MRLIKFVVKICLLAAMLTPLYGGCGGGTNFPALNETSVSFKGKTYYYGTPFRDRTGNPAL